MSIYSTKLTSQSRWDLIAYEATKNPYLYIDTLYANNTPKDVLIINALTEILIDVPENIDNTDTLRPSWVTALEV